MIWSIVKKFHGKMHLSSLYLYKCDYKSKQWSSFRNDGQFCLLHDPHSRQMDVMYSYSYLTKPHAARCDYCGVRLTDTTHTDSYRLNSESDIKFFFCLAANVERLVARNRLKRSQKCFFLSYFPIGVIFQFMSSKNYCIYGYFENEFFSSVFL